MARPLASFDLTAFVEPDPHEPTIDLEGTTRIGDRLYWITSHRHNKNGKLRKSRQRLFAVEFHVDGKRIEIQYVGKPYKNLLNDIVSAPQLEKYKLADAATRAPKSLGGFNIEGLAATPEGHLLIGLRNPVFKEKALVILLENPEAVVEGEPANLGDPMSWISAATVRGAARVLAGEDSYVIVAGPPAQGRCQLYTWSGLPSQPPVKVNSVDFKGWSPEAFAIYADSARRGIQVIDDDGTSEGCQTAEQPSDRTFRSGWVKF